MAQHLAARAEDTSTLLHQDNLLFSSREFRIPGQVPNFINTLFSDLGAGTLGPTGVAPYTGTFKPVNLFSSIYSTWPNSSSANGVWSFHILDHINSGFTGVFNNYTLCITYTTSNVTYSWTSNPAGFTSTLSNPSVTPAVTTDYTVVVTAPNGCNSLPSTTTVTVNPIPAVTLGPNPSVCRGTTSATLPYTATAGTPNQYSITYNAAALAAGFANVGFTALPVSPIGLVVPAAAAAATYNGTITFRNSTAGCSSAALPFTVTVNAVPTITLGLSPTVCSGSTTANLPYTATTGSPNQYSIVYNAAAIAAGFVNVPNTALPATPIVLTVPAGAAAATYNGTLTVTNSTTGCVSTGTAFTVTVTAAPTITLGANPSVCSGATIANLPYTGTTGTPNQYSITYNAAAIAAGFVNVAFTALPATPIILVVPAGAPVATYGGTITVRNGAAGCPSAGTPFLITVSAPPTITLGANPVICSGATTANLPYTATTNSPDQYSIVYSAAALAAGFVNVPNTALPGTPIVLTVPAGAPAATYSGTLTVTNSTTGCPSAASPFTVTVNPHPSITLGANPSVCSGTTTRKPSLYSNDGRT